MPFTRSERANSCLCIGIFSLAISPIVYVGVKCYVTLFFEGMCKAKGGTSCFAYLDVEPHVVWGMR
jgi:hypothetical protein